MYIGMKYLKMCKAPVNALIINYKSLKTLKLYSACEVLKLLYGKVLKLLRLFEVTQFCSSTVLKL